MDSGRQIWHSNDDITHMRDEAYASLVYRRPHVVRAVHRSVIDSSAGMAECYNGKALLSYANSTHAVSPSIAHAAHGYGSMPDHRCNSIYVSTHDSYASPNTHLMALSTALDFTQPTGIYLSTMDHGANSYLRNRYEHPSVRIIQQMPASAMISKDALPTETFSTMLANQGSKSRVDNQTSGQVTQGTMFNRLTRLDEQTKWFEALHLDMQAISDEFLVQNGDIVYHSNCAQGRVTILDTFALNYDQLMEFGLIDNINAQVHASRKIVQHHSFHFKGNYKEKVLAISERLKKLKLTFRSEVTAKGLIEARRLSSMLKSLLSANYEVHRKAVKHLIESSALHYMQDLRRRLRSRSPQLFMCLNDFSGCEEEVNAPKIHTNLFLQQTITGKNVRQKATTRHHRQHIKNCKGQAYR